MVQNVGEPELRAARGAIPYRISEPDRVPARRYYDPGFYAMECERLWPRVWQMACRLEEIPRCGDFVVYEILDQSVIVTRVDDQTVKAYHNACRHRGVRLAKDRGSCPDGFVCPFHGWKYSLNGNCTFVHAADLFDRRNLDRSNLALRECRVELWGGCAFINFDDHAPPLRESIEPFASMHDAWHVESLRTEWWLSARLPVNWKLAMEAFMEGYHVMATHPQLLPPGSPPPGPDWTYARVSAATASSLHYGTMRKDRVPKNIVAREFIEMNIHSMRVISEGMAGMTHAKDVRVAETLINTELPPDPISATLEWRRKLNDAVMQYHREHGMDIPDLNDVDAKGWGTAVNFCFPNYFLLPTYGSASSYRIRPLGPEECLFDLWSLTRYPEGEAPPPIRTPIPMPPDDPRWPPIPTQDFSNLPQQQLGLHAKGFEYMRLSSYMEGLISNYQRLIDGYLAGLGYDRLLPAAHKVSGCIDAPIADLGL